MSLKTEEIKLKHCNTCKKDLPLYKFGNVGGKKKHVLRGKCKTCFNNVVKKHYREHKNDILEYKSEKYYASKLYKEIFGENLK